MRVVECCRAGGAFASPTLDAIIVARFHVLLCPDFWACIYCVRMVTQSC
nr:MAG TPA: hypothetical protein [Caudoviricetes sp.]